MKPPKDTQNVSPPGKGQQDEVPPPSYDTATMGRDGFPPDLPEVPDLPDVPHSDAGTPRGAGNAGGDVDFDELTRRFEELKRRK